MLTRLLLTAQEEERRRIASDLHDEIGQCLSAVQFAFGGLLQQLEDRMTDPEKQVCASLTRRVTHAIGEVRRICLSLRPPMLDDLGLISAIDWFCSELRQVMIGVDLTQDLRAEENAIPPPVMLAIFRILQEACSNVCKHAEARRLSVHLQTDAEGVHLEVADDGIGFDATSAGRFCRSFGLASMRERAAMTNGHLTIRSRVGNGTRILALWQTMKWTEGLDTRRSVASSSIPPTAD